MFTINRCGNFAPIYRLISSCRSLVTHTIAKPKDRKNDRSFNISIRLSISFSHGCPGWQPPKKKLTIRRCFELIERNVRQMYLQSAGREKSANVIASNLESRWRSRVWSKTSQIKHWSDERNACLTCHVFIQSWWEYFECLNIWSSQVQHGLKVL